MRIQTGNFGGVVAAPQQQARVRGNNAIGGALSNLGQTIGGITDDMRQAELQKQRSAAAMTAATLTNDLHDMHDTIGRDVSAGTIPAEQAVPEFQKRMTELTGARTKDLTTDQRQIIDSHLINQSGGMVRSLTGIAVKRTQEETGANLINMSEQFRRAAMRDLPGAIKQWDASVDSMGPSAGWSAEKIAQAKQAFKEGANYTYSNSVIEGAAMTGDIDLVRAARERIQGSEGESIDPERRTALITKAFGMEQGIIAAGVRAKEKADREAEAREAKAKEAYQDVENLSLQGRYLSPDTISELSTLTAGTAYATRAQDLVKSQAQIAGFASLSIPQQTAILEQRNAAGSTPGVGTSPEQQAMTNAMQKITDSTVKAYAENPWSAAQERGVYNGLKEASISDIGGALSTLTDRMKQIAVVEAAAGRKISPLQPQEADQIGRLVKSLPPDQQSAALAGFGKVIGSSDRLADFARQIDAKDKVLGTAMMVGDLQTTEGRYLSELIIKGDRALRDKSIMVDSARETGWRGQIAAEIGDAFPNQEVRDRMMDAAYYVQAGFSAEGGGADIKRAVRMVAGRIVEKNGSKIPLPIGMDEGTFDKRISTVQPSDLVNQAPDGQVYVGKTAVPVAQFVKSLADATLVSAGQGRYNVRAGMGLVTNANGDRITIEVRNAN